MAITAETVLGGVVEQFGDASYTLKLTLAGIQRFERKHRGIYALWDGFFKAENPPTSSEVIDLIALALVGGGLNDAEADKLLENITPADLTRLITVARGVLGVAFYPDAVDQAENPQPKKKAVRRARKSQKS